VRVPQFPYIGPDYKDGWARKPPVPFVKYGRPGVKLLDVMNEVFRGIDDRDDPAFDGDLRGITIRMHVGP